MPQRLLPKVFSNVNFDNGEERHHRNAPSTAHGPGNVEHQRPVRQQWAHHGHCKNARGATNVQHGERARERMRRHVIGENLDAGRQTEAFEDAHEIPAHQEGEQAIVVRQWRDRGERTPREDARAEEKPRRQQRGQHAARNLRHDVTDAERAEDPTRLRHRPPALLAHGDDRERHDRPVALVQAIGKGCQEHQHHDCPRHRWHSFGGGAAGIRVLMPRRAEQGSALIDASLRLAPLLCLGPAGHRPCDRRCALMPCTDGPRIA
mmetsp:Transcript_11375/g.33763  ORF Transcript_11375/g.33763 Transcript_11375/m.33763 type:complete len:263 (-) Transcript_11375:12-800(-)